ncbi:hypothetical protein GVO57_02885 [Sphingomonas changnyeongensis]|uniref:Transferrin-binding protein B C-lobe/N-lobe beta-barrel domain-containing protein n=1 Tax=Sphingomonas changnyeongensis TaxID=2698679 RepID=A0A7Z2NUC3_9SPHN|nr:transferrin-binding protein-like solute binding protein [Sphingomonas changnyeongensis]QHL89963.1 hypothetical protein GVO57_02885 [Sphingomonas changnyeongensis]
MTGTLSDAGSGVSLAYDAATGGYTIRDATGASTSFLPANREANTAPGRSDAVATVYAKSSGNRDDELILFNPGSGNTQLALTYVSYGAWQALTDNGATSTLATQYFVFGIRQSPTQPSTGSASYTTKPDGLWVTPNGVYSLSGTSSFTANFSAMTVSTQLNLTGTLATDSSTTRSLGTFNGTGTIAALGGGFTGSFTQSGTDAGGNTYSGGFTGAFFGPQGQEVGYSFRLTGTGGTAVGAVVGRGN